MDKPTCKTCAFYDADHGVEVYSLSHPSSHFPQPPVIKKGACKFYPHTTPHKTPDDFCGHHNAYPAYLASLKVS